MIYVPYTKGITGFLWPLNFISNLGKDAVDIDFHKGLGTVGLLLILLLIIFFSLLEVVN